MTFVRLALALLAPILLTSPAARAQPADAGAAAPSLRVMSFNIRYGHAKDGENRWDKRREMLFKTIKDYAPDVLGVQEAIATQTDELREQLPQYAFVGVGRDDAKRGGEFCGVYLKKDRFEPLDAGHFWLSPTPEVPGSKGWDTAITRTATWVKVRVNGLPESSPPLLIVNTHWDHAGKTARLESAKLIRAKVRELQPAGPVILMGDFNTTEDNPPYAELMRPPDGQGPRLLDSYRELKPERTEDEATFHGFDGRRAGRRIDFVLHSPEWKAAEATIDYTSQNGRYPSDHYPVTAVLEWKGK